MKLIKEFWAPILKGFGRLWKTSILALIMVALSLSLYGEPANASQVQPMLISVLAQGNAITDPYAILRYALPIDNEPIRKIQGDLEDISNHLRGKRWPPIVKDVKSASFLLTLRSDKILEDVPETRKPQAQGILENIKTEVAQLQEAADKKDREQVEQIRGTLLSQITDLEELMVAGFPFEIPPEYANLPQLKGRAMVEIETTKGNLTLVLDGYSAPVNAGNFVDLVQRGFYNNLPFSRSGDDFVVQTGDPIGSEDGFIDPETKEYRAIPLEILVKGDDAPIYGSTLEDIGIYLPDLALPFNAYGAVALARPSLDPNGGSSQFFFFKFDNELTPPGFNLMDGRYSVFGYVIDGKEILGEITEQDKIISAKVIDGLENLVEPSVS
jgi:peptidylprolyl isomerase